MKLLAAIIFLLTAPLIACAQQPDSLAELRGTTEHEAVVPGQVYTYVEQMPQLLDGGGMGAVVAAFFKRLRIPAFSIEGNYTGSAQVYFEVNSHGAVQRIRLIKSTHSPQVDSAIIAAIRSLPTFTPGRQASQPVTVSLTLPISCIKPQ